MSISHTFVRTYNTIEFADPYKTCNQCGQWITGMLDHPTALILVPCEHRSDYTDRCPSWSPVDGCSCLAHLGHVPHEKPTRPVPATRGGADA